MRIVALGGTVTEILFALGAGDRVVAVDATSVYPPEAARLPRVGFARQLSVEGVLAATPTTVIYAEGGVPEAALAQLRAAGIALVGVSDWSSAAAARERIRRLGALVGAEVRAQALIAALDRDLEAVERHVTGVTARPRVLFIYARGNKVMSVAGARTAAQAMIELAGGANAITGFEGFRPLTAEAVVAAAPEVLLLPAAGAESVGGSDGVLALPGVASTPAGRARRVVMIDDLALLGFGPRLGQAALELARALHPMPVAEQP
jgi:iron complex transport system substrate-binding protein